jgi:hypothetical protein
MFYYNSRLYAVSISQQTLPQYHKKIPQQAGVRAPEGETGITNPTEKRKLQNRMYSGTIVDKRKRTENKERTFHSFVIYL